MARSTASFQARILAALPLTSPNFSIDSPGPLILPIGLDIPLNIQFGNNDSGGYSNVQVEITGMPPSLVIGNNPESIGTLGAANAGFTNMTIRGNLPGGNVTLTATLTGELGGDTYQDTATFTVQW